MRVRNGVIFTPVVVVKMQSLCASTPRVLTEVVTWARETSYFFRDKTLRFSVTSISRASSDVPAV